MTRRNLELVESLRGGDGNGSSRGADLSGTLLGVFDRTLTPMGARMLRRWILAPLVERSAIDQRLDAVGALVADPIIRASMRAALDGVRDLERLASKTAAGRSTPRELRALGDSLARMPAVEQAMKSLGTAGVLATIAARWESCSDIADHIITTLVERPPNVVGEEDAIRDGCGPGSQCVAHAPERRQGRDRADPGGGARAHRHRVAQGGLQPGVRVLHRDLERQPSSRFRPTTSDARR